MSLRPRHRMGFPAVLGLAGFFFLAPALAQEGHPLVGTWSGDWGTTLTEREHLTLVMRHDGESVTGLINPGPGSVALREVYLDVTDWTVRLAARRNDSAGQEIAIEAEGQLEDLESYHRTLRGTWREGAREGDFVLTRD